MKTEGSLPPSPSPSETYQDLARELARSARDVLRSESRLVRGEIKEHYKQVKRKALWLGCGCALVFLGAQALLAFVVLTLGQWLGARYDLAALICAGVGLILGIALAFPAWFRLESNFDLPASRETLQRLLRRLESGGAKNA